MAPKKPTAPDYSNVNNAKDLFDEVGKFIKEELNRKSMTYQSELLGYLSSATFKDGASTPSSPCDLKYQYHTNVTSTVIDPCKHDSEKRFSDTKGAECDKRKIKDSNVKEGACAPYRRLSLCDTNLEQIKTENITTHNLLVDVCMAAKYEGTSLKGYHDKYKLTNSSSQLCTELARSFADIGDIIRGKDLYLGDNKKDKAQKLKLQENLKEIFKNIKNTNRRLTDLTDDQIREYWWELNRQQVWKALTCDAPNDAQYFRFTCSGGNSSAHNHCRCVDGDPPTYFDYVPQYLRWFEEWAEDFCRKKKKYVNIVKTYCRDETKGKYCSRNGCDCTKTVRAKGKLRYGNRCTDCLFACHRYENWIDNQRKQFLKQKEQFLKQKERYDNVINGTSRSSRKKRDAGGTTTTKYEGYEKKFYEQLKKGDYGTVDGFLGLLNNEKACKEVQDTQGGTIDFKQVNSGSTNGDGGAASGGTSDTSGTNNEKEGTFYRSKYCQPCPHCGMKKESNGNFVKKSETDKCKHGNLYRPRSGAIPTEIKILKSGEGETEIKEKLEAFCEEKNGGGGGRNSNSSLYDPWKCYKGEDVDKNGEEEDDEEDYQNMKNAGGLCILPNPKKNKEEGGNTSEKEPDEIQKTFNPFFYYWVAHMLKDSIYWETQKLGRCLEKKNGNRCRNGCNKKCECFKKWIEQKGEEWKNIVEHFKKQKDLPEGLTHDALLKSVLELEFSKDNSEENSAEDTENSVSAREIHLINEMLKEDETTAAGTDNKNKTTIDKLLQHEEKKAQTCLNTHKDNECKQAPKHAEEGVAKTGQPPGPATVDPKKEDSEVHSEEEEEEEEDGDLQDDDPEEEEEDEGGGEEEDVAETTTEDTEGEVTKETTTTQMNVCATVATALTGDTLKDACPTKYEKGREKFPNWKCIPTGNTSNEGAAKGGESAPSSGTNQGSICVPPRRRKLYVTPLTRLAGDSTAASQVDGTTGESKSLETSEPGSDGDKSEKAPQLKAVAVEASSSPSSSTPSSESQPTSTTPPDSKVELRNAFIQSAAVETFFLWHNYKQLHKPQGVGNGGLQQLQQPDGAIGSEETPETSLKSGKIPPDFLRQMFYTLGDYRDICIGVKEDMIKALKASADEKIEELQNKIKDIIEKQNGDSTSPQNDDKKVVKDTTVDYTKLTEKLKKENGKENGEYHYKNVKLKDEPSDTQAKRTQPPSTSDNTPTPLTNFISRPPYFRYLEEWGETFCRERRKRLEKIKVECTKDGDGKQKKCSGDGENCNDNLFNNHYTTFPDFNCPSCSKPCGLYKRWISRKKAEFEKQQKIYVQQKEKAKSNTGNIYDENFVEKLRSDYETIDSFLNSLKKGPCKKYNESGEDEIKFDINSKTLKHTEYCDPCPKFTVDCKNGKCDNDKGEECKSKDSIGPTDIENGGNSTEKLDMRFSDNSAKGFDDGLEACQTSGIFKGFREDIWKCGNVCGYNVCKPENVNGEKGDGKQIIIIRALFKRWLEYFLQDYNKIRKKLKPCIENGNGSTCINDYGIKHTCIKAWIEKKKTEWDKIKKHYKTHNQDDIKTFVSNLLSGLYPQTDVNKAIKPCKELDKFKTSCGLNSAKPSQNGHQDAIDCMIKKLEEKAKKCEENHAQTSGTDCTPSTENPSSTPPDDDEDLLLEENENQVTQPNICPQQETPAETVDESGCEEAAEEPAADSSKETLVPKPPQEKAPAPKPSQPPSQPQPTTPPTYLSPPLTTALVTSTLAWSVGIGFAANIKKKLLK
ncbi:hypothetical protein PFBG_01719 [Plasmodium falciparum 7G8]|uniref:Erythrocyte membrane protein 1 n=2 Tax=Plasmodium falciparum TaxID=5833 RepID=W7FI82_PLAF8|nr:hypothetical protein PFBG_01719 [Plasmodium falciparum 7G8]